MLKTMPACPKVSSLPFSRTQGHEGRIYHRLVRNVDEEHLCLELRRPNHLSESEIHQLLHKHFGIDAGTDGRHSHHLVCGIHTKQELMKLANSIVQRSIIMRNYSTLWILTDKVSEIHT